MEPRWRRGVLATATGVAIAAGIGGATGTSPAGAQVGCSPQFTSSPTSFVSRLCGMPDLDQRRTAAVLQGPGARPIDLTTIGSGQIQIPLALQGNGGCHCVPTSFTNLLAYYVGKGVVGSFPRAFAWDARPGYVPQPNVAPEAYLAGQPYPADEVAAYKAATYAIKVLGKDVKTGSAGCGTTFQSVLDFHAASRKLFPKVTFATAITTPGAQAPKDIANILAAGGTVSVAHGPYNAYKETSEGPLFNDASWGARTGGHVVTVRGVAGGGPLSKQATLVISDPATNTDPAEAGDTDRFRQSATSPESIPLTRVYDTTRKLYRWRWGAINEPEKKSRLLDKVLAVYPVMAVMSSGNSVKLLPGLEFNTTGTPSAELRARTLTLGTRAQPLVDAAFLPATGEVAFIRKGDDKVRAIGVGTRETRVVGDAPAAASQLEVDPTGGRIFVGGRSEIAELPPHPDDGDRRTVKVSSPVRALAFDPSGRIGDGRLVAITADRGLTRLRPGTLARAGATRRLPAAMFEGSGPVSATVDGQGRLYVRRGSSDRVSRVTAGGKTSRGSIGALRGTGGFVVGERGTALTVIDGKLAELTPGGKPAPASVFSGRPGGGRIIQVVRSGADIDPADADTTIDSPRTDPDFPEIG